MPEICGIISSAELSPDQLSGWENMANALCWSKGSYSENIKQAWARISVVKHHAHDTAVLTHRKDSRVAFGYIGNEQELSVGLDSFGDYKGLKFNKSQAFIDFTPPFAACILDTQNRIFKLIGDQYGLLSLYYSVQNNALVFCTKLDPLLRSGLVKWKLDVKALIDFFTYEHMTGDRTLSDAVQVLSPATMLQFKNSDINNYSYANWICSDIDTTGVSLDSVADIFYEKLSNSVASAVKNRSRVAITLSGGLDSRALLGCAVKHRPDLKTYTFGMPDSNDIRYARELARVCGVRHISININGEYFLRWFEHGLFITSGMVSCIHYHILQLADLLTNDSDVVIDGLGGGALTGAHLKPRIIRAQSREFAVNAEYQQIAAGLLTTEDRGKVFDPDFLHASNYYDPQDAIRKHFKKLGNRPLWYGCHLFDLKERQRQFNKFGPQQLRTLVDVQTPFYAVNLVEFLKDLDASYLVGQKAYRHMHIKHFPELAKIPDSARGLPLSYPSAMRFAKHVYDYAHRRMPPSMRRIFPGLRKHVDYEKWFRTELRSFVEDQLLDSGKIFEGIFRKNSVRKIVLEHMSGKRDHAVKIGCLLTFNLWYTSMKQFADN